VRPQCAETLASGRNALFAETVANRSLGFCSIKRTNAPGSDVIVRLAHHLLNLAQSMLALFKAVHCLSKNIRVRLELSGVDLRLYTRADIWWNPRRHDIIS
jgi:hypothetical protein